MRRALGARIDHREIVAADDIGVRARPRHHPRIGRRYDARFFVAVAPDRQVAAHDNREAIAHEWARPAELLEGYRHGARNLRTPTRHTLKRFSEYHTVKALIESFQTERDISAIMPRITREGHYVIPGEPGYEEAAGSNNRDR